MGLQSSQLKSQSKRNLVISDHYYILKLAFYSKLYIFCWKPPIFMHKWKCIAKFYRFYQWFMIKILMKIFRSPKMKFKRKSGISYKQLKRLKSVFVSLKIHQYRFLRFLNFTPISQCCENPIDIILSTMSLYWNAVLKGWKNPKVSWEFRTWEYLHE